MSANGFISMEIRIYKYDSGELKWSLLMLVDQSCYTTKKNLRTVEISFYHDCGVCGGGGGVGSSLQIILSLFKFTNFDHFKNKKFIC